jgi:hypothetical protein
MSSRDEVTKPKGFAGEPLTDDGEKLAMINRGLNPSCASVGRRSSAFPSRHP